MIMGWGIRGGATRRAGEGLTKLAVDMFSFLGFAAIEFMTYNKNIHKYSSITVFYL